MFSTSEYGGSFPGSRGPQRVRRFHDAHDQSYRKARQRVIEAVSSVLGPAADLAHQALFLGVDLLQFAPVPALDVAGKALLGIWDAVEMIEINRLASLRLTERCAELLLAIREEIGPANADVTDELREPVARLHSAFEEIGDCLQKQVRRPFWLRYVKREEVQRDISYYDTLLDDALGLFSIRIQIRTLKLVQVNEASCQPGESSNSAQPMPGGPPTADALPAPQDIDDIQHTSQIRRSLAFYRESQNLSDRSRDLADLRQLLHAALQTNDDVAMMDVLQVGRDEMPEAIKVLQRALQQETRYGPPPPSSLRAGTLSKASGQEHVDGDAHSLDQAFIRTSVRALKRLSQVADPHIPAPEGFHRHHVGSHRQSDIAQATMPDASTEEEVCPGCQLSVIDENGGVVVSFGSSLFHVACFKCAKCHDTVTADTNLLLLSDGNCVCTNCSYLCSSCHFPILDEAIMTGDDSYHAYCFKCKSCGYRIDELIFAKTWAGIYCMSCHKQRIARTHRHAARQRELKEREESEGAQGDRASSANAARRSSSRNQLIRSRRLGAARIQLAGPPLCTEWF
ncbi:hypothetical protein PENSPDRAFT_734076 [Peniophora sp. CONT]|nr:hypothetical protein PENSPDRAFT_734076 [Peniophora sp. CONT]